MKEKYNIDDVKQSVSINDYFKRMGIIKPDWDKLTYRIKCPWRVDRNPSLSVYVKGNIQHWKDHATGDTGTVIDACMKYENLTLNEALWSLSHNFSFPGMMRNFNDKNPKKKPAVIVDKVSEGITNPVLEKYLTIKRRLPIPLFQEFFDEIEFHFENESGEKSGKMYGFGMPDNNGDWHIHTCFNGLDKNGNKKNNKFCTGQGFTLINNGFARLVVVEGMVDCLSFMALYPFIQTNFLILNSVNNVEKAISYINGLEWKYVSVALCLDNDPKGKEATEKMLKGLSDYPNEIVKMAKKWLSENPDAPEELKKTYHDLTLCGNRNLTPIIWDRFWGVKTCEDLGDVWERVEDRERIRRYQYKSCLICLNRGDCNPRRGTWQLRAYACPRFKREDIV